MYQTLSCYVTVAKVETEAVQELVFYWHGNNDLLLRELLALLERICSAYFQGSQVFFLWSQVDFKPTSWKSLEIHF
jgi:hypothetical protein